MDNFLDTLNEIWEISFVRALAYLLIALVLGFIASFIVRKLLTLIIPKSRQRKWEERGSTAVKLTGKLIFLIVFLLFLPSVLEALGLESVSDPITDFASTFISYIPNIIAAAILVFIGIFIGQILEEVVTALLMKTKLDDLTKRLSGKSKGSNESEKSGSREDGDADAMGSGISISSVIGKTVCGAVVLIAIVEALTVLNIEAVSAPALSIIEAVFGVIPSIFLAVIVVAIGLVIANIACAFLQNLLTGLNLDGLVKRLMPGASASFSLTRLSVNVVRVVIILFVVAEGVDILGLTVLSGITAVIISYLPMVVKALIIAIAALYGASLVERAMSKTSLGGGIAVKILKSIIYVVAAFMILSQLEFATVIVNYAFIISISALAVAFAIAFGIGGKDFAKKTLEKVNLNTQSPNSDNKEE